MHIVQPSYRFQAGLRTDLMNELVMIRTLKKSWKIGAWSWCRRKCVKNVDLYYPFIRSNSRGNE